MPLTCEIKEKIPVTPDRVFAALIDLERRGEWMPGFVRVEPVTPGPVRKGSQWRETRKMFGHEASEVFEVTEFDPPRMLELYVDGSKGASRTGWYRFRYTLTPTEEGTDLHLGGEFGGATGCLALLGRVMMKPMKKAIANDLSLMRAWIVRPRE